MKGSNPNHLEEQGEGLTGDAPPPCRTVDPVRDLGLPLDEVAADAADHVAPPGDCPQRVLGRAHHLRHVCVEARAIIWVLGCERRHPDRLRIAHLAGSGTYWVVYSDRVWNQAFGPDASASGFGREVILVDPGSLRALTTLF